MRFLISFLVSVLNQLWILRGHFLCCRSLMRLQGTPYCRGGRKTEEVKVKSWQLEELASFQQFQAVTLLIYTQVVVETHFFSSSLARTKRVKFLSNMKPISNAMPPPTHEAMMVARVLSTTLTADSNNKQKG